MIGLLLALGYTAYGGISFRGIRLDLWFAGFFALLLPFGWFINMDRTNESRPLYKWLARPYTRPLFRTARKRAPFTAEYEFRGDLVVYFRITGDKSEVVWHNRMYGVSCSGNGYTMLYKNSRSFKPHALFLHHPSAEFNALLEALGITPMPEQAGGP